MVRKLLIEVIVKVDASIVYTSSKLFTDITVSAFSKAEYRPDLIVWDINSISFFVYSELK